MITSEFKIWSAPIQTRTEIWFCEWRKAWDSSWCLISTVFANSCSSGLSWRRRSARKSETKSIYFIWWLLHCNYQTDHCSNTKNQIAGSFQISITSCYYCALFLLWAELELSTRLGEEKSWQSAVVKLPVTWLDISQDLGDPNSVV